MLPNSSMAGSSGTPVSLPVAVPCSPTTDPLPPPARQLHDNEAPMEVEDSICDKQFNSSGVDVDSGIENMEVEDSDRKEIPPRSRVRLFASK